MLVVMIVRTVLKVPFEKAAPYPFRHSGTPGCYSAERQLSKIESIHDFMSYEH